jgi:hypothetical protein
MKSRLRNRRRGRRRRRRKSKLTGLMSFSED